jgi:hypothetical protein
MSRLAGARHGSALRQQGQVSGREIRGLTTFRRKIDVFGSTVNGFGQAKTAWLPAVFFEGLW